MSSLCTTAREKRARQQRPSIAKDKHKNKFFLKKFSSQPPEPNMIWLLVSSPISSYFMVQPAFSASAALIFILSLKHSKHLLTFRPLLCSVSLGHLSLRSLTCLASSHHLCLSRLSPSQGELPRHLNWSQVNTVLSVLQPWSVLSAHLLLSEMIFPVKCLLSCCLPLPPLGKLMTAGDFPKLLK